MKSSTIDFGIDLGTTNSAIAVLRDVTPEIIKNNAEADITPSAVSYDKKGAQQVGVRAKNKSYDAPDDSYVEFKRNMGASYVYKYKSSGLSRKPEELSAEVLKSLREDVRQRLGAEVEAAVITVPAAFLTHQCEATNRAAQLAGFRQHALLQEPVAAALAFGFQAETEKAFWLVYDFGGGTFDAALIKAEDGSLSVVNHGGDNYLGGSDIDRALVDQLLVPRLLKENKLEDFNRSNNIWKLAFLKLQHAAEIAKIELSRAEKVTAETRFKDGDGEEIEFECELTRGQLIGVAEPIIVKSADIARRVLAEKKVAASALERVILVGGPTLAPYFRDILRQSLGVPLDFTVDPLTVVARGAAVFAGTQSLVASKTAAPKAGEFQIELKYKPIGQETDPLVGIKVPGANRFPGMSIEIINTKTRWTSGQVPLDEDGTCMINLLAEKGERNIFKIELRDATGSPQLITPESFNYTIGAVIEEQPLINSIGIGMANNDYDLCFQKGHGLPLRASRDYYTTTSLNSGQTGDLFSIPIYEGENTLADRNFLLGKLQVDARNIPRDLPAGSVVEVRLTIDESRTIQLKAYVEVLNEEYDVKVKLGNRPGPEYPKLKDEVQGELRRLDSLLTKARQANNTDSVNSLEKVQSSSLLRDIADNLAIATTDPVGAAKCEKYLLELRIKLDEIDTVLEWPTLVKQARESASDLEKLARDHGTPQDREKVDALCAEINGLIEGRDPERLRKKVQQVDKTYFAILTTKDFFWVNEFQYYEKNAHILTDQAKAETLFDQGRLCLERGNVPGLRNVVIQLIGLLPAGTKPDPKRNRDKSILTR